MRTKEKRKKWGGNKDKKEKKEKEENVWEDQAGDEKESGTGRQAQKAQKAFLKENQLTDHLILKYSS